MKAPLVAAIAGLMIGHCRADVLFSNGTLVTHAGAGYHGADVCQDIAVGIGGFNSAPSGVGIHFRIADDVAVAAGGWRVSAVTVHTYTSASVGFGYGDPPESPVTGINVRIWNGVPDVAGSAMIAESAAMVGNQWSGIYRIVSGEPFTSRDRPIMDVTAAFTNVDLGPGTYWIDYQVAAALGPVLQAITPPIPLVQGGVVTLRPGNARHRRAAGWVAMAYSTGGGQGDAAFTIEGTTLCYANCDASTSLPLLNVNDFNCFLGRFAAGDPYANCDRSTTPPVLNVSDFNCFLASFAQGCP